MELIRKEIIVRESARVDQNEEVIKHFFIPVRLNMLNVMPIIFYEYNSTVSTDVISCGH